MGEAGYKGILYVNLWGDDLLGGTYLFFVIFLLNTSLYRQKNNTVICKKKNAFTPDCFHFLNGEFFPTLVGIYLQL